MTPATMNSRLSLCRLFVIRETAGPAIRTGVVTAGHGAHARAGQLRGSQLTVGVVHVCVVRVGVPGQPAFQMPTFMSQTLLLLAALPVLCGLAGECECGCRGEIHSLIDLSMTLITGDVYYF